MIAFVGSVFSPTYFSARRRETEVDPQRFCSINVALYGADRKTWVFTEPSPTTIVREEQAFGVGGSRLAWHGDALHIDIDERTTASGRRVRGSVRLHPEQRFDVPVALDPDRRHHWWGVAPIARMEVDFQTPGLRFEGSGYHDTNFGDEPLERGFERWSWCRADLPSAGGRETAVLYDVHPRRGVPIGRGFRFGTDGVEPLEADAVRQLGPGRWGVERPVRLSEGGSVQLLRNLEDTPFYTRSLIELELDGPGRTARAMHESLDLDRFVSPLVQLMLPFRLRRGWRA